MVNGFRSPPSYARLSPPAHLRNGLIFYWSGNRGGFNSSGGTVRDEINRWEGTCTTPLNSVGDTVRTVYGADARGINFGNQSAVEIQTFTVAALVRADEGSSFGTAFGTRSGNTGWEILPISGNVRFRWGDGATLQQVASTSPDIRGRWTVIVGTFTSGAQELWFDGVSKGTASRTDTIPYNATNNYLSVANDGTPAGSMPGCVAMACMWDRVLTDDEIREFSANPWMQTTSVAAKRIRSQFSLPIDGVSLENQRPSDADLSSLPEEYDA